MSSVCPWTNAKGRNFFMIGGVGVFAGEVYHYKEEGTNQNDLSTKIFGLSMCTS